MTVKTIGPISTGSAAGSAGSATANGNSDKVIAGRITGIYVQYNDSPPAGTDLVIKTIGTNPAPPSDDILTLSNNNTDGWNFPQRQTCTKAGALITGVYSDPVVNDYVNVEISGCDAGDSAEVWIQVEY